MAAHCTSGTPSTAPIRTSSASTSSTGRPPASPAAPSSSRQRRVDMVCGTGAVSPIGQSNERRLTIWVASRRDGPGDRRAAGAAPGRRAVPAVGAPADRGGRVRRRRQPDVPPGAGHERAAAERRVVRAAGREGAAVAAAARSAASAPDPGAARAGRARRGLSVRVVGLSLARGRERERADDRGPDRSSRPRWRPSCARSQPSTRRAGRSRGATTSIAAARWRRTPTRRSRRSRRSATRSTATTQGGSGTTPSAPPGTVSPSGSTATSRRATCWSATAGSRR